MINCETTCSKATRNNEALKHLYERWRLYYHDDVVNHKREIHERANSSTVVRRHLQIIDNVARPLGSACSQTSTNNLDEYMGGVTYRRETAQTLNISVSGWTRDLLNGSLHTPYVPKT